MCVRTYNLMVNAYVMRKNVKLPFKLKLNVLFNITKRKYCASVIRKNLK